MPSHRQSKFEARRSTLLALLFGTACLGGAEEIGGKEQACGNGVLDEPEHCDLGANNSDQEQCDDGPDNKDTPDGMGAAPLIVCCSQPVATDSVRDGGSFTAATA